MSIQICFLFLFVAFWGEGGQTVKCVNLYEVPCFIQGDKLWNQSLMCVHVSFGIFTVATLETKRKILIQSHFDTP